MGFQKIEPEKGFASFFTFFGLTIQKIRFETALFLALLIAEETRQTEKMLFDDGLVAGPDPAFFFFLDPRRERRMYFFSDVSWVCRDKYGT